MSAQYQGAGLVPEYIIMYYTAHLHTPGYSKCNIIQLSLLSLKTPVFVVF